MTTGKVDVKTKSNLVSADTNTSYKDMVKAGHTCYQLHFIYNVKPCQEPEPELRLADTKRH